MTNRDVVLSMEMKNEEDGSILMLSQSITHDKYPEKKNLIRMEFLKISHFKQDGENIVGKEFTNLDFKGYFPVKMLNMIMGSLAGKGIEEFGKRVRNAPKEWINQKFD